VALDRAIMDARSIPELNRTAKQKLLAAEKIYFADENGNFDEEQVDKHLEDATKLVEKCELRLLEEIQSTPTTDASTASILLSPSKAMVTLLQSQEPIFGPKDCDNPRMLLDRLKPKVLDDFKTYAEIEKNVEDVVRVVIEEVIVGTGFNLNWSVEYCQTDESMAILVKKLVEDRSDPSALKDHETITARVAMKLVLILVEKQALLGLVSGRLRTYTRTNGRMAIWGMLPPSLRKYYCIGMARKYGLTNRVYDFDIVQGYEYLVSPNSFEMY
jgi:hypothetical protein